MTERTLMDMAFGLPNRDQERAVWIDPTTGETLPLLEYLGAEREVVTSMAQRMADNGWPS